MSIESKIEGLTIAINRLADALNAQGTNTVAPSAPAVQEAPAPAAAPTTVVETPPPAAPAAPVMPEPPTFVAPPTPAAPSVPFSDNKGLIDYVMGAYKALGPQKGAAIQNVLVSLGYANINDVKTEHYAQLYAGVEALKG